MGKNKHGHDMNETIYWALIGIGYTGDSPNCDGCGPNSNHPPALVAAKAFLIGNTNASTIPTDASEKFSYPLAGDWGKVTDSGGTKDPLVGAKLFQSKEDANAWLTNYYNQPNHKAQNFFAKYKDVIAVPVKISTAYLGE
jgi:hypothetical protein